MNADQENIEPSVNPVVIVCSAACSGVAAHINGLAKESKKWSRGPWNSDAE